MNSGFVALRYSQIRLSTAAASTTPCATALIDLSCALVKMNSLKNDSGVSFIRASMYVGTSLPELESGSVKAKRLPRSSANERTALSFGTMM